MQNSEQNKPNSEQIKPNSEQNKPNSEQDKPNFQRNETFVVFLYLILFLTDFFRLDSFNDCYKSF